MRKSAAVLLPALLALVPVSAAAQMITHAYSGVVLNADGPDAGAFHEGAAIRVEYTLDTQAADHDPSPGTGAYPAGLRSITVHVISPGAPTFNQALAVGGPGQAQVYNDADTGDGTMSDQVFFNPSSYLQRGMVGRRQLESLGVGFFEYTGAPRVIPTMIGSDALPSRPLLSTNGNLWIQTRAGSTVVLFVAEPVPVAITFSSLVQRAVDLIGQAEASEQLAPRVALQLSQSLHTARQAHEAGNDGLACTKLAGFRPSVQQLVRLRAMRGATGTALLSLVDDMEALLSCG